MNKGQAKDYVPTPVAPVSSNFMRDGSRRFAELAAFFMSARRLLSGVPE
jgi:hypothetical protein